MVVTSYWYGKGHSCVAESCTRQGINLRHLVQDLRNHRDIMGYQWCLESTSKTKSHTIWLVVLTILKNMSSSMGRIIPYMKWKIKHVPNHQPAMVLRDDFLLIWRLLLASWLKKGIGRPAGNLMLTREPLKVFPFGNCKRSLTRKQFNHGQSSIPVPCKK